MLLKFKSAIFLCCRCCKTSSQRELSQFHCCFREIFINEDSCVFNFFAFRKTLCLYLELKNLQSTFRGFDLFIWNLPMRWQRSISISSVISNLFLVIFITCSLKFSQVLLHVSEMPSIRILLRRDLSSSHVNFSMTKVGCKRSSTVSLRSVSTFLISFLTLATLPLSYPWVNTRFLVMPITSCEILSSRSLVFVSWEFYRIYILKIYISNIWVEIYVLTK